MTSYINKWTKIFKYLLVFFISVITVRTCYERYEKFQLTTSRSVRSEQEPMYDL